MRPHTRYSIKRSSKQGEETRKYSKKKRKWFNAQCSLRCQINKSFSSTLTISNPILLFDEEKNIPMPNALSEVQSTRHILCNTDDKTIQFCCSMRQGVNPTTEGK